ncbi:hypothetical protein ACGVWS_10960 [Enterobacteriaceae bacterium LUAb1]
MLYTEKIPAATPDSTEQYTIDVIINEGTCNVDLSQRYISIPAVQRADLTSGSIAGSQKFSVNVQHCSGTGGLGSVPVLTITGLTLSHTPGEAGYYLFNKGGTESTAKGFGIVLSTTPPVTWDTTHYIYDGQDVMLTAPTEGAVYRGEIRDFYVGVGCGNAATCTLEDNHHTPGSLVASITFIFNYH